MSRQKYSYEFRKTVAADAVKSGNKSMVARRRHLSHYLVTKFVKEFYPQAEVPAKVVITAPAKPVGMSIEQQLKFDSAVVRMYSSKMHSAKSSGKPFELRFDFVRQMIIKGTCAYTGAELDGNASFERIDPFKGYTEENTVLTTKEANEAKSKLDAFLKDKVLTMPQKKAILEKILGLVDFTVEPGLAVINAEAGKYADTGDASTNTLQLLKNISVMKLTEDRRSYWLHQASLYVNGHSAMMSQEAIGSIEAMHKGELDATLFRYHFKHSHKAIVSGEFNAV